MCLPERLLFLPARVVRACEGKADRVKRPGLGLFVCPSVCPCVCPGASSRAFRVRAKFEFRRTDPGDGFRISRSTFLLLVAGSNSLILSGFASPGQGSRANPPDLFPVAQFPGVRSLPSQKRPCRYDSRRLDFWFF